MIEIDNSAATSVFETLGIHHQVICDLVGRHKKFIKKGEEGINATQSNSKKMEGLLY